MKTIKENVIDTVIWAAKTNRIVSLKKAAAVVGVDKLNRHDTDDVMVAVLKALPDYRAVEMYDKAEDLGKRSRFGVLHFIDKTVEFDW